MAEIQNAKITNAELTMEDHGVLCYWITVEGAGWGVSIGGYVIGKGYLGAKASTSLGISQITSGLTNESFSQQNKQQKTSRYQLPTR